MEKGIYKITGYITLDNYVKLEGVDHSKLSKILLFTDKITINDTQTIPIERVIKASITFNSLLIEFNDENGLSKTIKIRPYNNKLTGYYYDMEEQINKLTSYKLTESVSSEKMLDNILNTEVSSMKESNFNTEDFNVIKQKILSKKVWCSFVVGTLYPEIQFLGQSYFIFIDGFLYEITDNLQVKVHRKENIDYPYSVGKTILRISKMESYILSVEMKSTIDFYFNSFSKYESEFLKDIEEMRNELLSNSEIKLLLTNYLALYKEAFYKEIPNILHEEEILLTSIFYRESRMSKLRGTSFIIGSRYTDLIELLDKKKVLGMHKVFINHEFGNFLKEKYIDFFLTTCLKSVAIKHFSNYFKKEYGNYFKDTENMSIDECINCFLEIDIIEHTSITSISYLVYYLYENNRNVKGMEIYDLYEVVSNKIDNLENDKYLGNFEKELMTYNSIPEISQNALESITIHDIDMFSGIEFEKFIAHLFKKMGYSVTMTKTTGDQGIDLIVKKNGHSIGVQTKCYSSSVSNKAIQEVAAGIKYYNLQKGLVVTNNYFTQSAIELANSNDVIIWDREILKDKIRDFVIHN